MMLTDIKHEYCVTPGVTSGHSNFTSGLRSPQQQQNSQGGQPSKQYIVLPRCRPANRAPIRKRRMENTNNNNNTNTMKVVIPSNSNLKTSQGASIKKEYLASTIRPANTFSTLCNSILSAIYDSCQTLRSVDVYVKQFVELGVTKSVSSKIKLRRTTSITPPLETPASSPGKKYEDVIDRQRAEIDDLRARLIERKRLEETWKEMLNVLLSSIKSDYVKQKQKLAVANAKCKLIDLERKRKNTENANSSPSIIQPSDPANKQPRFSPTGKYAQKLSTLANQIISQKCQKENKEKLIILPNQGQNDEKKFEITTAENKTKFLLIKNSTNQNRQNSKSRHPVIMLKKKSVDQSKPIKLQSEHDAENESSVHMASETTQPECSPHKIRKVSHSSSSGGMSPDSGWGDSYSSDSSSDNNGGLSGHSDSNSSEPSSPVAYDIPPTPLTHHQHHTHTTGSQQSSSPSSPTQPEVKADMSNYIEQAFQFSMGMKPEVKTKEPEIKSEPIDTHQSQYPQQPIKSPEPKTQPSVPTYESSTSYNSDSQTSDVFDIFCDVNVDISYSKTAPPWEELDIEIEPCFKNNITPFYFN